VLTRSGLNPDPYTRASSFHWRYQFPALAGRHRVYSLCLVGYGWSAKGDVDYSHELWGAQIRDFVQEVPACLMSDTKVYEP